MRTGPSINGIISIVVMLAGLIVATRSKAPMAGVIGGALCVVGLIIGIAPGLVTAVRNLMRKPEKDETRETNT